jgi:hypothetical protein
MCHVRPAEEQRLIMNYSCLLPVTTFFAGALVLLSELLLCDRITISVGTWYCYRNISRYTVLLPEHQSVHSTVTGTSVGTRYCYRNISRYMVLLPEHQSVHSTVTGTSVGTWYCYRNISRYTVLLPELF